MLSSLAFRKAGRRGLVLLFLRCALWVRAVDLGGLGFACRDPWDSRAGQDGSSTLWLPCMQAWWRLLNLSGYDACWVIGPKRAAGGKHGQKKHETSLLPLALFLVSLHSPKKFLGMSGLAPLDREGQTSRAWVDVCRY